MKQKYKITPTMRDSDKEPSTYLVIAKTIATWSKVFATMATVEKRYSCRKCRSILFEEEHLISHGDNILDDVDTNGQSNPNKMSDQQQTSMFLLLDHGNLPEWVEHTVEEVRNNCFFFSFHFFVIFKPESDCVFISISISACPGNVQQNVQ